MSAGDAPLDDQRAAPRPPLVINLPPGAAAGPPPGAPPPGPPPPSPEESEDCLLLDVMVPVSTFNAAQGLFPRLAPVVVWIHGGGFALGSKVSQSAPATLLTKSVQNGQPGIVFVEINYRLGLFGFPPKGPLDGILGGGVDSNAGYFDQRLALQWVQQNIRAFGGDPQQVTVMGESAGGASIWAQLQAFGSVLPSGLMKRAIIQSPAQRPASDPVLYGQVLQQFLAASNLTSVSAARALSTEQVQSLNQLTVGNAPFGTFTYGPNIDGEFIPGSPFVMLEAGLFDHSVDVIVAHNANEGLLFTDPRVQDNNALIAYLTGFMPSVNPAVIQTIATTLYPEDFSGAQGYTTPTERLALLNSEAIVGCNSNALQKAFGTVLSATDVLDVGAASSYLFAVSPAIHAQDVGYTFFNGPFTDVFGNSVDEGVANQLQAIILDFAIRGRKTLLAPPPPPAPAAAAAAAAVPGAAPPLPPVVGLAQPVGILLGSLPVLPLAPSALLSLNVSGQTSIVQDPTSDARCLTWQFGLVN